MIFGHDRWGEFLGKMIVLALVLAIVFIHGYIKKKQSNKNNDKKDNDCPTVDGEQ